MACPTLLKLFVSSCPSHVVSIVVVFVFYWAPLINNSFKILNCFSVFIFFCYLHFSSVWYVIDTVLGKRARYNILLLPTSLV